MEPRKTVITITGTPYSKELYEVAPDMYEVLKEIDESCARCPICHNTKGNGHDYTCKLGNALSKAEGRNL